jgi:hypothetical protein
VPIARSEIMLNLDSRPLRKQLAGEGRGAPAQRQENGPILSGSGHVAIELLPLTRLGRVDAEQPRAFATAVGEPESHGIAVADVLDGGRGEAVRLRRGDARGGGPGRRAGREDD